MNARFTPSGSVDIGAMFPDRLTPRAILVL
jgi:hypothetical protein